MQFQPKTERADSTTPRRNQDLRHVSSIIKTKLFKKDPSKPIEIPINERPQILPLLYS